MSMGRERLYRLRRFSRAGGTVGIDLESIDYAVEGISDLIKHIDNLEKQFTCHKCSEVDGCKCAWDSYNIGGDCLANK